ncbi:MAG: carboxypeptidase-like regulatory domain-containing protein [Pirellulales bacterium]|nr:carboxypeptidase-like regulatory domain-containing protein [Pirellulales bacterium]
MMFYSSELGVSRGALTNEKGEFRVTAASGPGLPPGEYLVVVRPAPKGDEEMIDYNRPDIPKRLRSKKTSPLSVTIREAENDMDLEVAGHQ